MVVHLFSPNNRYDEVYIRNYATLQVKDVLARLRVDQGDIVYFSEAPDGSFRLTPYDPVFEEQMRMAETIMREDRDILRILAK